jgi:hypothetical protein
MAGLVPAIHVSTPLEHHHQEHANSEPAFHTKIASLRLIPAGPPDHASAAGEIMVRAKSNGGQHQMKLAPLKSGARVTNGW